MEDRFPSLAPIKLPRPRFPEMRVTKNGMGQYLWLMFDILAGPQQRRKVFDPLNLVNAKEPSSLQ